MLLSLTFAPLAFAAPNSVQFYDAKRAEYNASKKTITDAVVDGSIVPDIARVQTQIIDGVKKVVYIAFDRNMTAVERHCQERKRSEGKTLAVCLTNSVKARQYPTVSSAF